MIGFRDARDRWIFCGVLALAGAYLACFFVLQWMKLGGYDPTSHDLINFVYMWGEMGDALAGRVEYPNIGGLISQPLYNIILPFYALHASMVWPVLYTVLPMALAIVALYLLGRAVLQDDLWALLLTVSFALHPVVNTVSALGLRGSPLFMCLYFLEVLALQRRRSRRFLLLLVLANLSRLNGNLINLLFGAVLWARGDKRYGRTAILVSLVTTVLSVGAIAGYSRLSGHAFSADMIHMERYGDSMLEALTNMLANPVFWTRNVLLAENLRHLGLFLPVLFFPFLAPLYLIPAGVDLLFAMLTTRSYLESVWMGNLREALGPKALFHNNLSFVIPVVYVAALYGLRSFLRWSETHRVARAAAAVLLVLVSGVYHYLGSSLFGGPMPLTPEFNRAYYTPSRHAAVIDRAWGLIPDGSRVKLKDNLVGRQAPRMEKIYHLHFRKPNETFDYVLTDLFAFCYMFPRDVYLREVERFLRRPDFRVRFFEDGVLLLERGPATERNRAVLAFLDGNRGLLERNLFNPYVFGRAGPSGDGPGPVYSPTQLVE